ncbi:SDR family oxidoreductase [Hoeflea sp. WL0058]|uniref:SDR family oxidoreductase n=1 Tax=Flavimaribacter sediminis TaxID=2865987 RepID=A0AAE3D2F3_9HYPH|nr:SDR family oxidoreductase [Flavimaribacter sediminis]
MDRDYLKGLRVLVNAAGGGLGNITARRFAAGGAQVFVSDVDADAVKALEADCEGIVSVPGDAGDEGSVLEIFNTVTQNAGGLDVLINNIGIAGPTCRAEDLSLDDWNESLRVNVTSHFLFARSAIPLMKAQKSGLIVNVSSGSAKVGLPLRLPYVVSKGAVLSLTMNLARELGPDGIRVNAILPGPIRGDRIQRVIDAKADALGMDPEDLAAAMLRYVSMRTLIDPEDISAMIEFLASPHGKHVSGQFIGVDGNVEWEE